MMTPSKSNKKAILFTIIFAEFYFAAKVIKFKLKTVK